MTLKRIKAHDLRIGMYVVMPTSWDAHPFLKNKFCLSSQNQIDKIIDYGLYEVLVEADRSTEKGLQGIAAAARLYDVSVDADNSAPQRRPPAERSERRREPEAKAGGPRVAPLPADRAARSRGPEAKRASAVVPPAVHKRAPAVVPPPAAEEEEPRAPRADVPTVITDKLLNAIQDRKLPAEEKSRIVRDNTLTMMDDLMNQPTAKNIQIVRKAIAEVVEMILTDDATASYLTKITSHDFYTYTHSVNVGFLGVSMAKILFKNSNAHNMHELGIGFFLHDLGKVQIDPAIINKPGRLTPEEMDEMRKHPAIGYQLLADVEQMTAECNTIVLQHHERYDGAGYPKGLKGEEIHQYGKICSIADVYDALTSDRPYRNKLAPFDALILMKKEMINHFQKDLYEKFVLMLF